MQAAAFAGALLALLISLGAYNDRVDRAETECREAGGYLLSDGCFDVTPIKTGD